MTLPIYYPGKNQSATEETARNRIIREGQISGGPGVIVNRTGNGSTISVYQKPEPRTIAARHPFQLIGPYLDGSDWKVGVYPGTLNGLTPVVGDITGTGGTSLTATPRPRITLATGENIVVLAIKVDLETHAILRSTIEVREDSDLTPITDTGARTRITFEPLAELAESGGTWSKLIQARNTNLTYDYGVVYNASA
jgi:hypothetical protein